MKTLVIAMGMMLLLYGTELVAQDGGSDPREELSFGAKIGLNYSNVWSESGQDFRADPKAGFAGGIFFSIPIGTFLGVQPELMLSQKGFQGSGTLLGYPYSFTKTTTYLDVPLQVQLKPTEYLTVVVGPQYSYLLHEKNEYRFGENSTSQEEEFENDNIRRNILGFVVGADFSVSHLVVSGRFGWDFMTNRGDGTSYTPEYKNRWLQLTIGYKI